MSVKTRRVWKIRDPVSGLYWNGNRFTGFRFDKIGHEYPSHAKAADRFVELGVHFIRDFIGKATSTQRKVSQTEQRTRSTYVKSYPSLRYEIVELIVTEDEQSKTPTAPLIEKAMRYARAAELEDEGFAMFLRAVDRVRLPYSHIVIFEHRGLDIRNIEQTFNNLGIGRHERRIQTPYIALRGDTAAVAARLTHLPLRKIVRVADLATLVDTAS